MHVIHILSSIQFPENTGNYILWGLSLGAIYGLIAVGYTMVYGIIKLVNFAHGEVFMISVMTLLMFLDYPGAESPVFANFPKNRFLWLSVFFGTTGVIASYSILRNKINLLSNISISCVLGLLCGFATYYASISQTPFEVAMPLGMILAAALAISLDTIAYRPLRNAPRLAPLITAIGMSILLYNLAILEWQSYDRRFDLVDANFLSANLFGGKDFVRKFAMTPPDWVILIMAFVVMAVLYVLVNRTKMGAAMRAVSLDKPTSRLMGIDVDYVITFTFAFGAVVAFVGAYLYQGRFGNVQPTMSLKVGIIAFAAAVLGGIGSIPGAMLGGILIGIVINAAKYLNAFVFLNWEKNLELDKWELGFAYGTLILFIIFRPQGILGKKSVDRA